MPPKKQAGRQPAKSRVRKQPPASTEQSTLVQNLVSELRGTISALDTIRQNQDSEESKNEMESSDSSESTESEEVAPAAKRTKRAYVRKKPLVKNTKQSNSVNQQPAQENQNASSSSISAMPP